MALKAENLHYFLPSYCTCAFFRVLRNKKTLCNHKAQQVAAFKKRLTMNFFRRHKPKAENLLVFLTFKTGNTSSIVPQSSLIKRLQQLWPHGWILNGSPSVSQTSNLFIPLQHYCRKMCHISPTRSPETSLLLVLLWTQQALKHWATLTEW